MVATLDHAASKVFWREIFVEVNSRLLLLLNRVIIMCEKLLIIMAPVVQVRDVGTIGRFLSAKVGP